MKNYKFLWNSALVLFAVMIISCEKEEIMSFEAQDALNFTEEEVAYSFLGNPESEFIQDVAVQIIGNAKDVDRAFEVEIIQDSLTTAAGNQYEIIEGIIKAGDFTGTLKVKLLNSQVLDSTNVSLHVRIKNSDNFEVGNTNTVDFVITWTNQIIVPKWGYFKYWFSAKSSTSCYRLIVETTGIISLSSYSEVRAYGGMGKAQTMGQVFGDYVKQWNLDHPDNHLKHDDGDLAGEDIVPKLYTKSLYD